VKFEKIKVFIKEHLDDIVLLVGVILISLLSFAVGFIFAKQQEKEPLKIEKIYESSHYWSGNLWSLFGSETFREWI